MNNSESAKKGFRTFILTLSISLIVFSGVYYLLTTYGNDGFKPGNQEERFEVVADTDSLQNSENVGQDVQGAKDERSVFAEIINKKTVSGTQEVLAGATTATQTTQSTTAVPTTGYIEMTLGLIISFTLFVAAMIYTFMNPRKLALSRFEKDIYGRLK